MINSKHDDFIGPLDIIKIGSYSLIKWLLALMASVFFIAKIGFGFKLSDLA